MALKTKRQSFSTKNWSQDFERCQENIVLSKNKINKLFVNWNLVCPTSVDNASTMRRMWKCWTGPGDVCQLCCCWLLPLLCWIIPMFFSFIIFRLKTFLRKRFFFLAFSSFSQCFAGMCEMIVRLPFCLTSTEFRSFCLASVTFMDWHCTIIYVSLFHAMHTVSINHFNNDNSVCACVSHAIRVNCGTKKTTTTKHKTLHAHATLCLFFHSRVVLRLCHIFHFFFFGSLCSGGSSAGFAKMLSTKAEHNFLDIRVSGNPTKISIHRIASCAFDFWWVKTQDVTTPTSDTNKWHTQSDKIDDISGDWI